MSAEVMISRDISTEIQSKNNNIGGQTLDTISRYEDTSYLLEGTGFPIQGETDVLERLLYENIEKKPYLSIVNEWLTLTEQSFFHFTQEHMRARPLLGYLYSIEKINGIERLRAPKSANAVIADVSSFQERYGSQKKAIIGDPETGDEGFESFFKHAPIGSIVARTSPPGESGYSGYVYREAQTQFMIKVEEDGVIKIKGFNVRTMTTVEQSEELLRNLGVPDDRIGIAWAKGQEYDRLCNVTGINVYFPADIRRTTIEDLFDEWQKIFGDAIFNREEYSVENMKNDLQRFDELINLDTEVVDRIEKIKNYTTNELMRVREEVIKTRRIPRETLINLQKVYGTMVLDFWLKIKYGSQPMRIDNTYVKNEYPNNPGLEINGNRYNDALKELRAASGCPGVTSKSNNPFGNPIIEFLENPYGGIFAEFNPFDDSISNFENTGNCPKISCSRCKKWTATDAEARKVQKGEITCCPNCGWKPGESTVRLPENKKNNILEEVPFKGKKSSKNPKREFVMQKKKNTDGTVSFKIAIGTHIDSSSEEKYEQTIKNNMITIFNSKTYQKEHFQV